MINFSLSLSLSPSLSLSLALCGILVWCVWSEWRNRGVEMTSPQCALHASKSVNRLVEFASLNSLWYRWNSPVDGLHSGRMLLIKTKLSRKTFKLIYIFSNWSTRRFVLPLRISLNVLYLSLPCLTFSWCSTSFWVILLSSLAAARSLLSICRCKREEREENN